MSVSNRPSQTREWIAAVLMSLAVLTVYWEPAAPGYAPFASDFKELHERRMRFAREYLLGPNHTLPAWYPRELLGTPFWSNPQNFPFIPTRLLVLFAFDPDGPYAFTVAVSLAAVLASIFTYLYCRRIGLGLLASCAAGWTFACCEYFASRVVAGHLPLLEAYCALPLLLWCVESFVQATGARRARWLAVIGIGSACVALAGHPQLSIYSLCVAAIYALWRGRLKGGWRPLLAIAAGVGCAGFVLVPAAMLVSRSTRILPLAPAENDVAMPYRRLLGFFLPGLDSRPVSGADGPRLPFPNMFYIWDTICYAGWLPWIAVALLIVLIFKRKTKIGKQGLFVLILGIAGIALCLPWVQTVTAHLHGTFLRSPARIIYLTEFALALALGAAVHLVQRGGLGKYARLLVPIALLGHFTDLQLHDADFVMTDRKIDSRQADQIGQIIRQQLADDPGARAAIDVDLGLPINRAVDDVGFFDSIMLARPYRMMIDLGDKPADFNIQRLGGSELAPRALQAGGAHVVATHSSPNDLPFLARIGDINLYTVPSPAARARFFSSDQVQFLDRDQIHRRLRDPEFDVGRILLLPAPSSGAAPPTSSSDPSGSAVVTYRRPDSDHIECTVSNSSPGYLRVIESFDSGWSATVDGSAAITVPAMDALLCVPLPPGKHEVHFVYHTPGAAAGAVISLISLAMLIIVALARSQKKSTIDEHG